MYNQFKCVVNSYIFSFSTYGTYNTYNDYIWMSMNFVIYRVSQLARVDVGGV